MASSWLSPSFWKRMATVPSWWLLERERLGYELWIMGFMDHATVLICSFSKQSRLDNKNADMLAMRGFISLVVRKPRGLCGEISSSLLRPFTFSVRRSLHPSFHKLDSYRTLQERIM